MTGAGPGGERVWVVGPGRLGLALGLLLGRTGFARTLTFSGRAPHPPDHPLFAGPSPPARYRSGLAAPPGTTALLITIPDSAIAGVAGVLAAGGDFSGVAVLHLSGALGAEVLAPLAGVGASVGSLHPLAAVADPVRGADRLRGIAWGIEADGAALRLAERIVRAAEGRSIRVAPGGRPLYHAAAVLASNAVVALLAEAEGWMERAGIPPEEARAALAALAAGAVQDVAARGPARALTGPVARGDAATVRGHLARLSPDERRLYSTFGRRALRLARDAGLAPDRAAELEASFGEAS